MAVLPVILIFVFMQKYIVQGAYGRSSEGIAVIRPTAVRPYVKQTMKGGITMVIDMHVHPGFYEKNQRG